jgi:hypothetical protein
MKSFKFKQIQKKLTLQSYSKHIWLRHEVKKGEKRSPLTPTGCKELLNEGFKITVEKSLPRLKKKKKFKFSESLTTTNSRKLAAPSLNLKLG